MQMVLLVSSIAILVGGIVFLAEDTCGDGTCTFEEIGKCPKDCEPEPQNIKKEYRCGDGVCHLPEAADGTCPEDCRG